jgi:predicted molibdopterin-dependent oxidoreductase YjgC
VFGAGGGTSSFEEIEHSNVILLWGSNARAAHPIFFHHLLKGVHNGARLYCIDPRRSESARWADVWLGIDVGSDIALANAMAKVIIDRDLHNKEFIDRATTGFAAYAEAVNQYSLDRATEITGIPGDVIEEMAITYATADMAQICWTLGITEHHNATDNVLALISLALLTGHVGRYGSGLAPLRGQNNVQGGGDMGAIPNKLPGFQDVENEEIRSRIEGIWGRSIPPKRGWHLSQMFEAMEAGMLRGLYVIGENPADSEADVNHARKLLAGLDFLVVQDIFMTRTAAMADVILPSAADWCESEGTVTNSERRVQRVRKALEPPGEARTDISIINHLADALGGGWGHPSPEEAWDELRQVSPMHAGMSYSRLDALGGIQWPCWDENHPGEKFIHHRLWEDPVVGERAPFLPTEWVAPVDRLTHDYPYRLTTGRYLDDFNTGVQTGGFDSPTRIGGTLDISPEDAERIAVATGDLVQVSSRRGSIQVPVRLDESLRGGLVFMSVHYAESADVNQLTIEAWDPKSGTAEFKATAVRLEKVEPGSTAEDMVGERVGI